MSRITPRLVELFDAWVFAARDAELALRAWASSATGERADAHAVYRAALDREECAASLLAGAAGSYTQRVACAPPRWRDPSDRPALTTQARW